LGNYTLETIDAVGNVKLKPTGTASPTLELTVLSDPTTRLLKLKKGEVDVVLNDLPPELYTWGLKQGWPGLAVLGSSYTYMGLNFTNPYLANISVRQALALAINAPAIRRTVLGGLAAPASSLLPPGHPLAWEAPEMPHDIFTAEELLDSAGYLRGPDNTRFTLVLSTSTDALASRVAQALQSQLQAIGINLVLRPTEWSAFFTSIQKGQYDAVLLTWTGAQTPISYFNFFHASQMPPNGLNRGRVDDEIMNAQGEAIQSAGTQEQLAQAILKAQQRQNELLPYVPLYRRHHTLLARPGVHGCQLPATGAYTGLASCTRN
jgi:peptide/nickel transport system substrate-binding protein